MDLKTQLLIATSWEARQPRNPFTSVLSLVGLFLPRNARNPQRNMPVLPGLIVELLMQGTDGGNTTRVLLLIYLAADQNLVLNQESLCEEEKVFLY